MENLQNKKSGKAEKAGSITNLIFDIYGVILRDDLVETEIAKTVDFIRENYKNPESKFAFYYLSNISKDQLEKFKKLGIYQCFAGGIGSCDSNFEKPQKEFWLEFLDKFDLMAENCIFIDDSDQNVEMAETLDFKTILFDSYWMNLEKEISEIELENILKDYKLYKYGKTWVVQNDVPSMKKTDSQYFENLDEKGIGKLISFDEGKNWLRINKWASTIPDTFPKEQESLIKKENFRYESDKYGKNRIKNLRQIIKNDSEIESEKKPITRYFILNAGLVNEDLEIPKITSCNDENNKKLDEMLVWIEIESIDGKNRQRLYLETYLRGFGLEKNGKPCDRTVNFSKDFSEKNTELLKQKFDL